MEFNYEEIMIHKERYEKVKKNFKYLLVTIWTRGDAKGEQTYRGFENLKDAVEESDYRTKFLDSITKIVALD